MLSTINALSGISVSTIMLLPPLGRDLTFIGSWRVAKNWNALSLISRRFSAVNSSAESAGNRAKRRSEKRLSRGDASLAAASVACSALLGSRAIFIVEGRAELLG